MNVSSATSAVSDEIEQEEPKKHASAFLKSFENYKNSITVPDATFLLEFKNVKSKDKLCEVKKIFFDELHDEIETKVQDLLKEGKVINLLNKFTKIWADERSLGKEYKNTPKWRPSGVSNEDLRPFRTKELTEFRQRLISTAENLETENSRLKEELINRRRNFKQNFDSFNENLKQITKLRPNKIEGTCLEEIKNM